MILLRKIVFYLCLVIYLAACPLTILDALGYTFAPGDTPEVMKTGVLSLSTVPDGATVYVENRRYTKRTPTVLQGMRPGSYHLKLLLKDHEPWDGTVGIEPEQATVLTRALLLSKHPKRREVLPDAFERLIPIPETRFLLLLRGSRLDDVLVYDEEADDVWPLLEPPSPLSGATVIGETVVTGSPFVLFQVRSHDGEHLLGASLKRDEVVLTDLTSLFAERPARVEWDPREPQQLFTWHDGALDRVDVDAREIFPAAVARIRGYGLHRGRLYVVTDRLTLQRLTLEGKPDGTTEEPLAGAAATIPRSLFRVLLPMEDVVMLWGERGELLTSPPLRMLEEEGVRGVEVAVSRALLWRKDAIGLLDLSAQETPPPSSFRRRWVFRAGRGIHQALWVDHGSHIVFCDHAGLSLLDLAIPEAPVRHRLVEVRPGTMAAYAEGSGTLYYLDRRTNRLSSLELIPRSALLRVGTE